MAVQMAYICTKTVEIGVKCSILFSSSGVLKMFEFPKVPKIIIPLLRVNLRRREKNPYIKTPWRAVTVKFHGAPFTAPCTTLTIPRAIFGRPRWAFRTRPLSVHYPETCLDDMSTIWLETTFWFLLSLMHDWRQAFCSVWSGLLATAVAV